MIKRSGLVFALCAAAVGLTACDLIGPDGDGNVAVRFAVARTDGSASVVPMSTLSTASAAAASVSLEGRNGVLTLDRIVLVVDKLELEGRGDACGRDDDEDDDHADDEDEHRGGECEFEARGFVLDLPLDGSGLTVASDMIPNGIYDELDFKVEDIEFDDDDDDRRVISMLEAELRSLFPNWPSRASAMVQGSFDPVGDGATRPFTVFLDAELKVEMKLDPPLQITDSGASRVITVEVHPEMWFRRFDGSVLDLSALDFTKTGFVVKLDPFGRGFRRGHDDDD